MFIGDTETVTYRIAEVDPQRRRSRAEIEVTNQDGTLVAVGQHLLKLVANPTAVPPTREVTQSLCPCLCMQLESCGT